MATIAMDQPDTRNALSSELMDQLVDSNVKALVIACNSASSACLRDARERYDVPVVEVRRFEREFLAWVDRL